jgi:hypothetical protein
VFKRTARSIFDFMTTVTDDILSLDRAFTCQKSEGLSSTKVHEKQKAKNLFLTFVFYVVKEGALFWGSH